MAGQHFLMDLASIVTRAAGVTAGYGVVLDTATEDGVTYADSDNSRLFAGVMMQTVSAADYTDGKVRVERRVYGNAEVKLDDTTTIGQFLYLLTTGKFAPITVSSTPTGYWVCARALRGGVENDLVPAEVICPPMYVEL